MPKHKRLTDKPIPIRVDTATSANIAAIIKSGIAKDASAALRAGAAALARGLVADPRVWVIHQDGERFQIFATEASAQAWLKAQGAIPVKDWWEVRDEDGDVIATYELEAIVPQ